MSVTSCSTSTFLSPTQHTWTRSLRSFQVPHPCLHSHLHFLPALDLREVLLPVLVFCFAWSTFCMSTWTVLHFEDDVLKHQPDLQGPFSLHESSTSRSLNKPKYALQKFVAVILLFLFYSFFSGQPHEVFSSCLKGSVQQIPWCHQCWPSLLSLSSQLTCEPFQGKVLHNIVWKEPSKNYY